MREEIRTRVCGLMNSRGLDALVTISAENFVYLNGFPIPSQTLMPWRHALTILTAHGQHAVVCIDMEATTVSGRSPDTDIVVWGEFEDDPFVVAADKLQQMGLANSRIGIETDRLSQQAAETLQQTLPHARFVAAQDLLVEARSIKTDCEIELLRRLSRIADRSISEALDTVSLGDSEMDIAGAMTRNIFLHGAENFKLLIVATGERSVFPNVGPSHRLLSSGDVCRTEIFAVADGYQAGVCRTSVVTAPPPHAERIWHHLVECKYMLMESIRPGASSRSVYDSFLRHMAVLDLKPIKFFGHSIGVNLHESPYLSAYEDVALEAGMVLGIEPLVYETGYGFGMQNKDMILVTDDGCELLSDVTDTDNLIVIK